MKLGLEDNKNPALLFAVLANEMLFYKPVFPYRLLKELFKTFFLIATKLKTEE